MKTLLKLYVGATRVGSVWWAAALLVSLSGCAGMRSPGAGDHSMVQVSVTARECTTAASFDARPKLERTARAAVGGVIGAIGGAVVGAGALLLWASAAAPACVDPTTCGAGVATIATIGAVVGGVVGAVSGAKTAWDESSGVARNSHACTTGPEVRSSGNSSSGEAELPHRPRSET